MTDSEAKIGITALGWTVTGVATVLTACRYVVRVRLVGGLKLDDLLHGLALLGAITFMIIDTFSLRQQYFSPADIPYYQRLALSSSLIGFVIVIYLVKFAFLAMYRSIFQVSEGFMLAWKLVCVFNGICFMAGFLAYFWLCGSPYQSVHPEYCEVPVAALPRIIEIMTLTCVLNSLSSIAVMTLPLSMLGKLHVRSVDKIGLAAIFLLAVADMIFDITRTITTLKVISNVLEAMASLEPSMAVIASALAALGPLFRYRSRKRLSSKTWSGERSKSASYGSSSDGTHRPQRRSRARQWRSRSADDKDLDGAERGRAMPRPMRAVRPVPTSPTFGPMLDDPILDDSLPHGVTTRVSAEHIRRKPLPPDPPFPIPPLSLTPLPASTLPSRSNSGVQRHTEVRIDVSSRYSSRGRAGW